MMTGSLPFPPYQGGALRAYGILYGLHQAGHQVTLLSFHDTERGVQIEDTPLTQLCEHVVTVPAPTRTTTQRLRDLIFSNRADIAAHLESEAMHTALCHLLAETNFDFIQFEGIEITNYLFAAHRLQPHTPTIYDAFNAEAELQRIIATVDRGNMKRLPSTIYSQIQSRRITHYERAICEAATAVIAVSDEDAAVLRQFRPDNTVHVLPSGVFADDYTQTETHLDLQPNAIVFTGKMDYRPNVDAMLWFASEVLPVITHYVESHLYIVGQKPHPRLDALRMNPNIEITGWVTTVQPYLHAADVYIAPLRMGSGTRLKLLEAMGAGCAIVATHTAAAGLTDAARANMVITDDPTKMVEAVRHLLATPDTRKVMGANARTTLRQHYDWPVLIPRLLQIYNTIGLIDGPPK